MPIRVEVQTGCCIAVSYQAKAYGVKTGFSVADAKLLCPHIVAMGLSGDVDTIITQADAFRRVRTYLTPGSGTRTRLDERLALKSSIEALLNF